MTTSATSIPLKDTLLKDTLLKDALFEHMQFHGWNKKTLSKKAKIDPTVLSHIFNQDGFEPSAATKEKLRIALGLPTYFAIWISPFVAHAKGSTGQTFIGNHIYAAKPQNKSSLLEPPHGPLRELTPRENTQPMNETKIDLRAALESPSVCWGKKELADTQKRRLAKLIELFLENDFFPKND